MKCQRCLRLPLLLAAAMAIIALGGVAWAQDSPPPAIDDTTSGAWMGTYGECSYVLAAYDSPYRNCEIPVLPGYDICLSPSCTGGCTHYRGGASQDILDCEYDALDMDGNGDQDFFYSAYAGRNFGMTKVLTNPDGTCSGQNATWVSAQSWDGCLGPKDDNFSYTISGVPAGKYRLAVYVMDWDSCGAGVTAARNQNMNVCIGAVCSGPVTVGDHREGVYQYFYVDVAAGDTITVYHDSVANDSGVTCLNSIAEGAFFDPYAGSMCANGKACDASYQDRLTQGSWTSIYGKAGYLLFDRPIADRNCQVPGAVAPNVQVGSFAGGAMPSVIPTDNVREYYWTNTEDYACGKAMAWIWNCDDPNGIALENPGDCGNTGQCTGGWTSASTWDDAGERQSNGPDLFVDVEVDLPGLWQVSFYAVDYDRGGGCRDQAGNFVNRQETFHLYQYHSYSPVFAPVNIGEFVNGKYVTYTLEGPFKYTLRVEATHACYPNNTATNAILSGVFVDPAEGYLCTGQEIPPDCSTNPGDFCTYTIGGWGAKYHGANPGTIRNDNWNTVYPPAVVGDSDSDGFGDLVIGTSTGGCKKLTFTDPTAVETYLPCGGPADSLGKNLTDPTCPKGQGAGKNVLASQVTGMRLNMDYSCAGVLPEVYGDPNEPCLGDLIITSGPFAGLTVREFLAKAEAALSCGTLDPGLTFADYNWTATAINENFDGCQASDGFLECPPPPPPPTCGLNVTKDVATGHEDVNGDNMAPDAYPGQEVTFTLNVEASSNLKNVVLKDVLSTFDIAGVTYDCYLYPEILSISPNTGQTYSYDNATNTWTFNLGNLQAGNAVTITYKVLVNLLAPIGGTCSNTATVTGTGIDSNTTCSDDDSRTIYLVPGPPQVPTGDIGTPGYWCNHIDQSKNNAFDAAQINGWLWNIQAASRYWSEVGGTLVDNSQPPKFLKVLGIVCGQENQGGDKDKLERHLLTLWLNVASFNVWTDIRLEQLCIGGKNFPAGTNMKWTIAEVITYSESELLDTTSTPYDYLFWKDVCDAINNSDSPLGVDACNGLQLDPVSPFDTRFDGLGCNCLPQ